MQNTISPLNVFISYTHKDKEWKEKLLPHLNSLIRQKYITLWYDNKITPGTEIDVAVMEALKESQIVLLLISADYLASQYCYEIEMKEAMKMREDGAAEVIPIMLRPVDLKGTPFDGLKSLPEDRKAVSLFKNEDEAYENIAMGIRMLAETWYKRPESKRETNLEPENNANHTNYGIEINGGTFNGSFVINNH